MSFLDDIEAGGTLITLGVAAIVLYFVYKFVNGGATCILKVGTIPGITGATAAQANAAKNAAATLQTGGKVIWQNGNCYDYQQPNGDVVQARSTFWGQLTGTPVTYTTVPASNYSFPSNGNIVGAQCCYGRCAPCSPVTAIP